MYQRFYLNLDIDYLRRQKPEDLACYFSILILTSDFLYGRGCSYPQLSKKCDWFTEIVMRSCIGCCDFVPIQD